MAKLSKQAKENLITSAINKLFLDKFKDLDNKTSELIKEVLSGCKHYMEAKQSLQSLSAKARDCISVNGYTACEITNPTISIRYRLGVNQIIKTERHVYYPRTVDGEKVYCYKVTDDKFTSRAGELQLDSDHDLFDKAKELRDEYKELFSLIGDVEKVVNSVSTDNQLKDLSPELYEMLPKSITTTTLMPAESLCRVNELLQKK